MAVKKTVLKSIGLLLLSLFSLCSMAQQDVYFAGVSYLGQHQLLQENYPQALRINAQTDSAVGRLDQALRQQMQQHKTAALNVRFDLADYRKGNSVVISLGIEKEYLSTELIGDKRKLIAKVSAQLLLFDYKRGVLLSSVPVAAAKNHVQSSKASVQDAQQQLFEDLYLGRKDQPGLLALASQKLPELLASTKVTRRFQVAEVSLAEPLVPLLPSNYSEQGVTQYIGQYFTAQLANQGRVAVLPYVRGAGFGNKMAGRFANGDVFNLTLPKPDYVFKLQLSNLKKAPYKDDMLFACRMQVSLDEPFSEKTLAEGHIHYAVAKLISPNHKQVDEWAAYQDAMEVLLDDFIHQLPQPQRSWVKQHSDSKSLYQQLKQHKKLFN
ncbi:hypothetical protein [Agarivorans sp.]|uniref:hypothetical protein n=1 Tax=Agarivorans sp. TaxID=1872412 RepID=UPI003CFDC30B